MVFNVKIVAALSLLATAIASPILEARSCSPNFQGNPLTIYRTRLAFPFQWNPTDAPGGHITLNSDKTPFDSSEFLVAFSGQPDGSYVFKMVADTDRDLQLQGFANGDLTFQPILWTGNKQNFFINCFSCGANGDLADGCAIEHVETGLCATAPGDGSTVTLATCTGAFEQEWNFHTP